MRPLEPDEGDSQELGSALLAAGLVGTLLTVTSFILAGISIGAGDGSYRPLALLLPFGAIASEYLELGGFALVISVAQWPAYCLVAILTLGRRIHWRWIAVLAVGHAVAACLALRVV